MAYYTDLRQYLDALDGKGKLYRFTQDLVRETEMAPLVFVQYRGLPEDQWRSFLFESVVDAKGRRYPNRVLMAYPASREALAIGLMCSPDEMRQRWSHGCAHPIEPVLVPGGPVHDVVLEGAELEREGLEGIGVPVEVPGFSGCVRTSSQVVTKDPETGIRNVGDYSGHFAGRTELRLSISPTRHGAIHRTKWQKRGQAMQVAIVVGATPNVVLTSSTALPYGVDEYAVAGGIVGEPVQLVKCRTVDLEVPATAEMVIEGVMTDQMEAHAAFGDYPGYLAEVEGHYVRVMQVTCITYRRNPIFVGFDVGFPPTSHAIVSAAAREMTLFHHLTQALPLTGVLDVACHYSGGARNYVVIRMRKETPYDPWQALNALMAYEPRNGKIAIVVDEDINPRDPEAINWAMSFRMQPHRDVRIVTHREPGLDASAYPPGSSPEVRHFPPPSGASALLIDATRKWAYTPVGLPRKEFMERALETWERQGLPKVHLKEPWHGYPLGQWREEDEENAQLTLRAEYLELWNKLNQTRRPMAGPFKV